MFNFDIYQLILKIPVIIIALTFHEYAHGWVADRLGDRTARQYGRLTLNPMKHLDPIGTLMLFVASFGWAKPVPVNPYNLRVDPKQGMLYVALAGPLTNAILVFIAIAFSAAFSSFITGFVRDFVVMFILINIVLAVFNMIPIPPLDGSRILAGILPGDSEWMYRIEQYGFIILIILIFTGPIRILFDKVIYPLLMIALKMANLI